MSPIEEGSHGRLDQALIDWKAQLAAGRAWSDVEAEIISSCGGRVDLLTGLLIQAETMRLRADGASQHASSGWRKRLTVPAAREHHAGNSDRPVRSAGSVGQQS